MLVDRQNNFVGVEPKFLGRRFDNPGICLMRDDPIDIGRREFCFLKNFLQYAGQVRDRVAKHFAALHAQLANRSRRRWTTVDI